MKFSDLVDIGELRRLCESYTGATGAVTAILDLDGNVLLATGWQDICTRFHREHPATANRCRESDTVLTGGLAKGEQYIVYRCKNGLVDAAVPIVVAGEHIANFFTGQFFLEPPDHEYFARQAEEFGFDKDAYLAALAKVPVFSEHHVRSTMSFFARLARLIGEMGMATRALRRSEERYRTIVDLSTEGILVLGADGKVSFVNARMAEILGRSRDEILDQPLTDFTFEEDLPDHRRRIESRRLGISESYERRFRRLDGGTVWTQASAAPLFDDEHRFAGSFAMYTDITERKRSEEAMQRRTEELERFERLVIGRELKMVELKARIAELERALAARGADRDD